MSGGREDEADTALARRLHQAGALDLETLQGCLNEVRALRERIPSSSLAVLLVSRRLVAPEALQACWDGLAPGPPPAGPAQGDERLGPYRLVRELARGGMGVVWEAVHEASGARHALKTLLPGLLQGEVRERFRLEAEAVARLDHPAIVKIHTAELSGPRPHLAQEFIQGEDLETRLRQGPLPAAEARRMTLLLARGLAHAHAQGVLHRDLKPQNVLVDEDGAPRLVDFGLARLVEDSSRRLTHTGDILGTPSYMAPEQAIDPRRVDARTDVYGLGGILYAMLTGQPPFGGALFSVLNAVIHKPPVPPSQRASNVDPQLESICLRALAKEPAERYGSAAEMAGALAVQALESSLPTWRAPALALTAGLLLASAAVGVWLWRPSLPPPASTPAAPTVVDSLAEARAVLASDPERALSLAGASSAAPAARLEVAEEALLAMDPARVDLGSLAAFAGPGQTGLRVLVHLRQGRLRAAVREANEQSGKEAARLLRALELEERRLELQRILDRLETEGVLTHLAEVPQGGLLSVASRVEALLSDAQRRLVDASGLGACGPLLGERIQQTVAHFVLLFLEFQSHSEEALGRFDWLAKAVALAPQSPSVLRLEIAHRWIAVRRHNTVPAEFVSRLEGCPPERLPQPFEFIRRLILLYRLPDPRRAIGHGEAALGHYVNERIQVGFHFRRGDLLTYLGTRYRELAWRRLLAGEVAPEELRQALTHGRQSVEAKSGGVRSVRHYMISLLLAGETEEARRMAARPDASWDGEQENAVIFLVEAALIERNAPRALELLEALRHPETSSARLLARAHARRMAELPGWEDDLERARLLSTPPLFPWRDPRVARAVVTGHAWWPGARD